jgi:hypothetical protein
MMKRARLSVRVVDNYSGKSASFVVEEGDPKAVAAKLKKFLKETR